MNANLTVSTSNPSAFAAATALRWAGILSAAARSTFAAAAMSAERAGDVLVGWHRRVADRRHLLTLDDGMLRDIGLSRADVETEAGKPFWRV